MSNLTLVVCKKCGVNRYIEARQYPRGLPDTCISCDRKAY